MSDKGAVIQRCNCTSTFQDERYGKGMRVHSVGTTGAAKCTVCGAGGSGKKK